METKLKIEAGKYYRRRDGVKQRVDVVWPEHAARQQPVRGIDTDAGCERSWFMDGRWSPTNKNSLDLISEWTEPEPPKWRAWTAEEVPVGAICRVIGTGHRFLIVAVTDLGLRTAYGNFEHAFYAIVGVWEHSLDHGKTWLPCGVLEGSK